MSSPSVTAEMRQSEVGMVPSDWQVVPLGSIMDFRNGVNADKAAYGSGVAFINVLEVITKPHLHLADIPGRVALSKATIDSYAVRRGDVLFNRTSETLEEVGLASVFLDDSQVVFGGFVIRGRPSANVLDPTYCGYGLRHPAVRSQLIARGQGAIRANIGQADMRQVFVPLPPIEEQRAIATALSDVDGLLAGLDALIAKKKALKQGAMQQLLTGKQRLPGFKGEWVVRRLGELGSVYGGLTGKSKADFGTGNARYIPFMNIMQGPIIDTGFLEQVRVGAHESQNRAMKGDLFFNGSSETPEEVGMCSVLREDIPNLYLNSFSFAFRLQKDLKTDPMFLSYWFRSPAGRQVIYSSAQGATRYNLAKSNFLRLEVPCPSPEEQTAIAEVLSDMDAELGALEARRAKTALLKQGMMQELLTGRTRLV